MPMNNMGMGFVIRARDATAAAFKSARNRINSFRDELRGMGAALIAVGAIATGASMYIIRGFDNALEAERRFGAGVAEVSTLIDEADLSIQQIRDTTMGMAETFGTEGVEQTKALYQTISAGITDAAEATETLAVANELAVGGVTNTATAVDGLTTIMNTYAAANLEARDVSDAFFVAIKAGKTTAGELASQIGRVAPNAEAAGFKMQELLAAMAAITTKGINTSAASSGLAAALANLNKPTADAAKEAKRLGISFDAASLRSKGFAKFLGEIVNNGKFTEDTMVKLFGSIEASKVMIALSSNEGAKFNEVLAQMEGRAGATKEAFDKMSATYDFQAKRLDALGKSMQLTFGKAIKDTIAPFVGLISGVAEAFNDLSKALPPGLRNAIVGIVGGLSGVGLVVGGLIAATAAAAMFGVTLSGATLAMGAFVAITSVVAIGLGGLGLAAYGAYRAIKSNVGGLGDVFDDTWRQIKIGFQGVMEILTGEDGLSKKTRKELRKTENEGVLAFLTRFQAFVDRFSVFWDGLKEGFMAGLGEMSPAIDNLKRAFGGVFDMVSGENTTETMEQWTVSGKDAGKQIAKLSELAIEALITFTEMGKGVLEALEGITAQDVRNGIHGLVRAFEVLHDVVGAVWRAIQGIYNFIQLYGAALGEFYGGGLATISKIKDVVTTGFSKQARGEFVSFFRDAEHFGETRKQFGEMINAFAGESVFGDEKAGVTGQIRKIDPGTAQTNFIKRETMRMESEVREIATDLSDPLKYKSQEQRDQALWNIAESQNELAGAIRQLQERGVQANVEVSTIGDAVSWYNEQQAGRDL